MKRQSGFTIIELLVVVGIIGVLAALAVSNFAAFKGNALNATAASDARTLIPAADQASLSNGAPYPPFILTGQGGTDGGLGVLGTQFGARYSKGTVGTIEIDANHYVINTQYLAGTVCYTVTDGVLSAADC